MKRLGSSDTALMSISPTSGNNHLYGMEFQSMLEGLEDEEGSVEESGQISEKKRRLSVDQVKALEKSFEVDNKLEPERKVKLAQEIGLQPRQVAVWFQNRRARWKTKQLERDYGVLKSNYEALQRTYEALQHDNGVLLTEIRELKSKLKEEKTGRNTSAKEELIVSDSDDKLIEFEEKATKSPAVSSLAGSEEVTITPDLNYASFADGNNGVLGASVFPDSKSGSSDNDSSALLNEDNSPKSNAATSFTGSGGSLVQNHQFIVSPSPSPSSTMLKFGCGSTLNLYQFSDSKAVLGDAQKGYQPQFVKVEEHNFFSGDEACTFFSDDQAPTLQWYCSEQWS
ncbi:hypothetical protein U1Q18_011298 [Sarracenia purpurea var. burkii]